MNDAPKNPAAVALGSMTSIRKAQSSKANGLRGGRRNYWKLLNELGIVYSKDVLLVPGQPGEPGKLSYKGQLFDTAQEIYTSVKVNR